jgi:hypothetical protein
MVLVCCYPESETPAEAIPLELPARNCHPLNYKHQRTRCCGGKRKATKLLPLGAGTQGVCDAQEFGGGH